MTENINRSEQIKKGGYKDDQTKVLFHLIPPYPLFQIAKLFTMGARKYSERNWEKGMPWSRPYNALMRHLLKWQIGQDIDPETGLGHMVAVAWNAIVLIEYSITHLDKNDRPVYDKELIERICKTIDIYYDEKEKNGN